MLDENFLPLQLLCMHKHSQKAIRMCIEKIGRASYIELVPDSLDALVMLTALLTCLLDELVEFRLAVKK
jgi:hypothetical protein